MGKILDFITGADYAKPADVQASLQPFTVSESVFDQLDRGNGTTYSMAMSIPAVQRAKQIICSTIGSLPLEQYNTLTGAYVEPLRVINQPDPTVPGSLMYSYTASDLFFFGNAYWIVTDAYAEDGRVRSATYVQYERVSPLLNTDATAIIGYTLDGKQTPPRGIGSIIPFYGLDVGLLSKAGRVIRAARALEDAAEMYAKEPLPQMVLKSNGTNLPKERIQALLDSWKLARKNRSTAFLNADVELTTLGFDPKSIQLNEARQYIALELSRSCGIPAHFLSAEISSMTYSNTLQERKALVDFSLRPIMTAIEQRLSMPDFIPSGYKVRFDLDDFLRGSALERAQIYQILVGIGAMSVEEVRREEDLIR